jgi:hypothetical protein
VSNPDGGNSLDFAVDIGIIRASIPPNENAVC